MPIRYTLAVLCVALPAALLLARPKPADKAEYVKKATRSETARAVLASAGLPTLEGKWYYAGPFDSATREGIEAKFPPERGVDLKATYVGKDGAKFGWRPVPDFPLGQVYSFLKLFPAPQDDAVV
jgi:hypothetical protein